MIAARNHALHAGLVEQLIHKVHLVRQHPVEERPANGCINDFRARLGIRIALVCLLVVVMDQQLDLGMQVHLVKRIGQAHLFQVAKHAAFALLAAHNHGQVIHAQHHVFGWPHNRLAVRRLE